eukprot:scaffold125402_cov69-Phaeocystis_antarctica.AAC.2
MRVGHAVIAQQLQRGAREAAAVEGERARLDLLVQAVHRLVERVLGVGMGEWVREWNGVTSYGERAAQFRDTISLPTPDLLVWWVGGGWLAGWRPHLEVEAAHEHFLGLAEAVDAARRLRLLRRVERGLQQVDAARGGEGQADGGGGKRGAEGARPLHRAAARGPAALRRGATAARRGSGGGTGTGGSGGGGGGGAGLEAAEGGVATGGVCGARDLEDGHAELLAQHLTHVGEHGVVVREDHHRDVGLRGKGEQVATHATEVGVEVEVGLEVEVEVEEE